MNRAEMAAFICGKLNQREAEDIAACAGYLTRRHDLIWQDALWKDALVEFRLTLSPEAADYDPGDLWLPTKGVLLLPSIVQRVIAARTDSRKLNIQRPEFFYRMDYDAFAKTGTATDFVLLPPCVMEIDQPSYLLISSVAGDTGATLNVDRLKTDGVDVERVSKIISALLVPINDALTERLDAIQKLASGGSIGVDAFFYPRCQLSNTSGAPITFDVVDADGAAASYTVAAGGMVQIESYLVSVAVPLGSFSSVPFGYKITWDGATLTPDVIRYNLATLTAAATGASKRQRIRLIEIPTQETTIRVLGKRTVPAFSADQDEPAIAGMENCLIAFGLADMLERDESYTQAAAKFQEALQLLDQLKKVETVQQAHNQCITPDAGYGDNDFFNGQSVIFP